MQYLAQNTAINSFFLRKVKIIYFRQKVHNSTLNIVGFKMYCDHFRNPIFILLFFQCLYFLKMQMHGNKNATSSLNTNNVRIWKTSFEQTGLLKCLHSLKKRLKTTKVPFGVLKNFLHLFCTL